MDLLPSFVQHWVRERAEYVEAMDGFMLCPDGDLFMNHSDTPSLYGKDLRGYAARDLAAGDEITCCSVENRVLGFVPIAHRPHH